jgi:hypothetical protein
MNAELAELPDLGEFDPLANRTLDGDMNAQRWAHDHKLVKRFRRAAVLNPHKSAEAGRAIFDEQDYITIWTPGSQLTVVDAPITSGFYMQRFRKEYEDWKAGLKDALAGTPLEHFPFMFNKVGLIAELKAMHIHTTEQLAELPDSAMHKIMGGVELRKTAQDYLAKSKAEAIDTEKQALKDQLAQLQAQVAQMLAAQQLPAPTVPAAEPPPFLAEAPAPKKGK